MNSGTIIARQNKYMQAFKNGKITSKERAKSLKKLGIEPLGVFQKMEKAGVFVNIEDDKYYMDLQQAESFIIKRARNARLLLGVGVFAVITFYLINGWI